MQEMTIGFIGGGNMATSLIGGLIANGGDSSRIWVSEPHHERRDLLQSRFAINTCNDNQLLVEKCDVIVLAVKPQMLRDVCGDIRAAVQARKPLLISIAAGIRMADIDRWLGGTTALVRTMPNTPALVRSGATALTANASVSDGQREVAESIMRAVGLTLWVDDEDQLDAVTAVSGSGPAYFFLILEAMEDAGSELGLPRDTARLLALQTAFGAAKMALESPESSANLRQQVTSPGGTTERALQVLEDGDIRALFLSALSAARDRAGELADQLGKD